MKSLLFSLLFLLSAAAYAVETDRSAFTGYISIYQNKAVVSQNIYLNLKELHKKLGSEILEDYSGLYSFGLEGNLVILNLKKENKRIEFGMIDSDLIDLTQDQRIKFNSLNKLKTKLVKFKRGIPTPRWSYGCGITGCDVDFDWKRSRKLLVEIEAFDGSTLCLAKGYKKRVELSSGSCD